MFIFYTLFGLVRSKANNTLFPQYSHFCIPRWPHLVLNLECTVAVTHNYAAEFGPFKRMCVDVVEEEPEFAIRWYAGLMNHREDLARHLPINKE